MRPVLQSDIAAAARAVLAVPVEEREGLCQIIVQQAQIADKYTRALSKPHPIWGNGTLSAAARVHSMAPEPTWDQSQYIMCVKLVLNALVKRRA